MGCNGSTNECLCLLKADVNKKNSTKRQLCFRLVEFFWCLLLCTRSKCLTQRGETCITLHSYIYDHYVVFVQTLKRTLRNSLTASAEGKLNINAQSNGAEKRCLVQILVINSIKQLKSVPPDFEKVVRLHLIEF